jgi:UrcA family protein
MRAAVSNGLKLGGAVAAGVLLAGVVQSLHAQPAPAPTTASYVQEVPVLAPEVVRQRTGTGRYGRPVEVSTLAMAVSYADLDLTRASDQKVLKDRIWSKARTACHELDARTPRKVYQAPNTGACTADAASESLKVAEQVIAAANGAA